MEVLQTKIHSSAIISKGAIIADGVQIGPFTYIHENVYVGRNTIIGGWCDIGVPTSLGDGSPLEIGENSHIRSHSVIYTSSKFGAGLITGHHVCIRECTKAGLGLQLGSNGDIQGHCEIGDFLRTHRNVHIGKKSIIGDYVWMFPDVLLTNDSAPPSEFLEGPIVGDYVVLCAKATLLPGVVIGTDAVVGAHALVNTDVPEGMLATGVPAKSLHKASILRLKSDPSTRAYPWRKRFHRGYPLDIVNFWNSQS